MEISSTEKSKIVLPGETIAEISKGFMSGRGTYELNGKIISSVLGKVANISKLVTVYPKKYPYNPEVGDVIIGRIISVEKKSWKVNLYTQREGILNLTAINLPQGEQRIRNEEDQMQMRIYFKENDLFSGEIQQINNNGLIHIQTRNLKYGKLKNGILIKVNHGLIKKKKHQFFELVNNVKIILGINGCVWIYFSSLKVEDEYFTDDKNKISNFDKEEKPNFFQFVLIILFRNIVKNLDENDIIIEYETIMRYYSLFVEKFRSDVKKDDKESFRKMAKIDKRENEEIILILKDEIKRDILKDFFVNNKNKNNLNDDVEME